MSKRRVVVTGMGIISPVGNDLVTAWRNVVVLFGAAGTFVAAAYWRFERRDL